MWSFAVLKLKSLITRCESRLDLLNTPNSERAQRVFDRRSFEQLTNHLFPRLGTELYIESGDMAGLYDTDIPTPEYVATAFAARTLYLKG